MFDGMPWTIVGIFRKMSAQSEIVQMYGRWGAQQFLNDAIHFSSKNATILLPVGYHLFLPN